MKVVINPTKRGRSGKLADINLHIEGDNYGIIEDCHQTLMHIISQYIRVLNMPEELISEKNF